MEGNEMYALTFVLQIPPQILDPNTSLVFYSIFLQKLCCFNSVYTENIRIHPSHSRRNLQYKAPIIVVYITERHIINIVQLWVYASLRWFVMHYCGLCYEWFGMRNNYKDLCVLLWSVVVLFTNYCGSVTKEGAPQQLLLIIFFETAIALLFTLRAWVTVFLCLNLLFICRLNCYVLLGFILIVLLIGFILWELC